MNQTTNRTWAEISIPAIVHNISEIRRITSPTAQICAVVKADAYGHGAVRTAAALLSHGADRLAAATLEEALALRAAFPETPIMMLSGASKEIAHIMIENRITASVYDVPLARAFSEAAAACGKAATIHIKIDTGMNRIGFLSESEDAVDDICTIAAMPNLVLEGIFTHFSKADETDLTYTHMQFDRFMRMIASLEARGVHFAIRHCCNSAATMLLPEMHLDMVRAGIVLYGLYPSDEVDHASLSLRPAMTLKTRVAEIKTVRRGDLISYGGTFTAPHDMRIGTLPVGYADGYSRLLSNKAEVLVLGRRAKVLGRICMDQCMIDLDAVQTVSVGTDVILFGSDGAQSLPVEELAAWMGTINYEVICAVGKRVSRVYID